MLEAEEVDGKKIYENSTHCMWPHTHKCATAIFLKYMGTKKKMPFLIVNKQNLSKVLHIYLKFIETVSFQKGEKQKTGVRKPDLVGINSWEKNILPNSRRQQSPRGLRVFWSFAVCKFRRWEERPGAPAASRRLSLGLAEPGWLAGWQGT